MESSNYDAELKEIIDSHCPWIKKSPRLTPTPSIKQRLKVQKSMHFDRVVWDSLHILARNQGFTNFSDFMRQIITLVYTTFPKNADKSGVIGTINLSLDEFKLLEETQGFFKSFTEQIRFASLIYLMKNGEMQHE